MTIRPRSLRNGLALLAAAGMISACGSGTTPG